MSAPTKRGAREREPWNGEFYACFGHGESRNWDEGRRYGFISAGGGGWYSNTLNLLNIGDRVWVKAPGYGFVGVGEVVGPREAMTNFKISGQDGEDHAALELFDKASYHRDQIDDPERMEYFVPIKWIKTVPLEEAVNDIGLFGNQNTVCKPTTRQMADDGGAIERAVACQLSCPSGDPLYPLARTGPVVPSHPGDDREQGKLSGRFCGRTLSRAARS